MIDCFMLNTQLNIKIQGMLILLELITNEHYQQFAVEYEANMKNLILVMQ